MIDTDDLLAQAIRGELATNHSVRWADVDALTLTLLEIVNDHNPLRAEVERLQAEVKRLQRQNAERAAANE